MRYALALVAVVVLAGYLDRPVAWEPSRSAAVETLDPFFPRALKAAESWREEAVPARIVGDGRFTAPPEDVPQADVRGGGRGSRSDPPARDGPTYAFLDTTSGDLLLVTVGPVRETLAEVPAPPQSGTGALDDLLAPVGSLLGPAGPHASTAPTAAPPPTVPAPTTPTADCDGWWLCLRVRLAAWWG